MPHCLLLEWRKGSQAKLKKGRTTWERQGKRSSQDHPKRNAALQTSSFEPIETHVQLLSYKNNKIINSIV